MVKTRGDVRHKHTERKDVAAVTPLNVRFDIQPENFKPVLLSASSLHLRSCYNTHTHTHTHTAATWETSWEMDVTWIMSNHLKLTVISKSSWPPPESCSRAFTGHRDSIQLLFHLQSSKLQNETRMNMFSDRSHLHRLVCRWLIDGRHDKARWHDSKHPTTSCFIHQEGVRHTHSLRWLEPHGNEISCAATEYFLGLSNN